MQGSSSVGHDPRGDQYAGTKTCIRCHQDIAASYSHSHHFSTSSQADTNSLKKRIAAVADVSHRTAMPSRYYFPDSTYVRLETNPYSQSCYTAAGEKTTSGKFDIAFGSGEKAQTYAYWKENKLYQLPLTWFEDLGDWANSPGFPAGHANFGRVITSRCFECHASYINREYQQTGSLSVSENLDRTSIVYGIDCERCHGPAARHAQFQQDNPTVHTASYITPIKALSRQRQLDICAVCHSGNDQTTQRSLFTFTPGDTLSHFFYPEFGADNGEPDVHGKQLQLLQASKCFRNTSTLTCTTCHNPHASQDQGTAAFITTCMGCHQQSTHAVNILKENEQKKRDFNLISPNCIDCHMPLQTSKIIHSTTGAGSKNIPYLLRTHKIAIYK